MRVIPPTHVSWIMQPKGGTWVVTELKSQKAGEKKGGRARSLQGCHVMSGGAD